MFSLIKSSSFGQVIALSSSSALTLCSSNTNALLNRFSTLLPLRAVSLLVLLAALVGGAFASSPSGYKKASASIVELVTKLAVESEVNIGSPSATTAGARLGSDSDSRGNDLAALNRISRMFEKLGGASTWANSKTLFVMEKGRHIKYGDGIVANFWYDLEHAGEKANYQHPDLNVTYGWNADAGWISRNGKLRDYVEDELLENTEYWHLNIFTILHQLAAGDANLHFKATEPDGILVADSKGRAMAEIRLSSDGEIYLWKQFSDGKAKVTLFGPYKSFGRVNFPDWGAAADGRWTSYYVQLMPLSVPFKKKVSLQKPRHDWHGGAYKKPCE